MTVWCAAALLALARPAACADDDRDLRAREAFAAGRYRAALDIYGKLYAETSHPSYMRNIGRCYQNLGDADNAIRSFREYLRTAKNLDGEKRAEIDGYIREMQDLKESRAKAPPSAPPPPAAAQVNLREGPPPPPEATPVYRRTWFWIAVGSVAIVAGAAALGLFTRHKDAPCPMGVTTCD